ncbi:MAG: hypothetical protein ACO1SV_14825 [Fimbriimonas sp.]
MSFKRNPRGHGHTVIYRLDVEAATIRILHIFHTAQDIPGRLRTERD